MYKTKEDTGSQTGIMFPYIPVSSSEGALKADGMHAHQSRRPKNIIT